MSIAQVVTYFGSSFLHFFSVFSVLAINRCRGVTAKGAATYVQKRKKKRKIVTATFHFPPFTSNFHPTSHIGVISASSNNLGRLVVHFKPLLSEPAHHTGNLRSWQTLNA